MKSILSKTLFLFILNVISMHSQEIFTADFHNEIDTFKNINETKGNKTSIQLILNEDGTYFYEGYVYNKKNKYEKIDCFKDEGLWSKQDNILTLESNKSFDYNKVRKYKIVKNRKLFFQGVNKKYSRKTKFKKVKEQNKMDCNLLSEE